VCTPLRRDHGAGRAGRAGGQTRCSFDEATFGVQHVALSASAARVLGAGAGAGAPDRRAPHTLVIAAQDCIARPARPGSADTADSRAG
jgi:hypothetical protein